MTTEICKDAIPQVAKAFKGVLEPVTKPGYCAAGDFNGDGMPDVFMVVKVWPEKVSESTGIKTIYPFSDQHAQKGRRQFLALHSRKGKPADGDWTRYDKLLLDGGSPILVLKETHEDNIQRVSQLSREVKELQVPRRAMRGEGIYLGTEAVDAILYWDGENYVFHEDPAGP